MTTSELLADKLSTTANLAAMSAQPYQTTLERLEGIRRTLETAESAQRTAVAIARQEGASWAAIAAALGISKQAAQQRYGR